MSGATLTDSAAAELSERLIDAVKDTLRAKGPTSLFDLYDLDTWAMNNGYIEESSVPSADRIARGYRSPMELFDLLKELDECMDDWEFTRLVRDWAVAEMAKHESIIE